MTRWLVDAQLPARLARHLRAAGHDAIHTTELPAGNRSSDEANNEFSLREQRVVITKDADFVVSFHRLGRPYKLLLVSTGNVSNTSLLEVFERHPTILVVHG
jgi:predicted nuclease of predicted toxin-antitoxin system